MSIPDFVAVDIETTGPHPASSGVYELACIKVIDGKIEEEYSSLIRTRRELPLHTKQRRSLTNAIISNAPPYQEVLNKFLEMSKGMPIVAHNSLFEERFLKYKIKSKLGINLVNPFLCTMSLARKQVRGLSSYSLDSLAKYYSLDNTNHHEALNDTRVCVDILMCLLGKEPIATVDKALQRTLEKTDSVEVIMSELKFE